MNPQVEFQIAGGPDARGRLIALEGGRNVPFEIRRVYYLTNLMPGKPRGFHAHRALRQLAVCVAGSCRFVLEGRFGSQEIVLSSPTVGVLIDPMVWHEMHDFSEDCVLMVLASEYYDESDYIRSYEDFQKIVAS